MNWNDEGVKAADGNTDLIKRVYEFMTPYVSKSTRCSYLNCRDVELGTKGNGNASCSEARVWGTKYFKGSFDRLVQVRSAVDPGNFLKENARDGILSFWFRPVYY